MLAACGPDRDAVAMATRPRRSTDTRTSRTIAAVVMDRYNAEAKQSRVGKRAFKKSKLIWWGHFLHIYRLAYNNMPPRGDLATVHNTLFHHDCKD